MQILETAQPSSAPAALSQPPQIGYYCPSKTETPYERVAPQVKGRVDRARFTTIDNTVLVYRMVDNKERLWTIYQPSLRSCQLKKSEPPLPTIGYYCPSKAESPVNATARQIDNKQAKLISMDNTSTVLEYQYKGQSWQLKTIHRPSVKACVTATAEF